MKIADNENILRKQLARTMEGSESHLDFASVLKDYPADKRAVKPQGAPHSAWQLLEHMRIAQWDILEFSRNPQHKSPKWPDEYWPSTAVPPDAGAWQKSVESFEADAEAMAKLIRDASFDLFAAVEGGNGQTLLREACVLAAHNSYHLGQLAFLKKMQTA